MLINEIAEGAEDCAIIGGNAGGVEGFEEALFVAASTAGPAAAAAVAADEDGLLAKDVVRLKLFAKLLVGAKTCS